MFLTLKLLHKNMEQAELTSWVHRDPQILPPPALLPPALSPGYLHPLLLSLKTLFPF